MHGRVKVRTSAEQQAAKKKEQEKKLEVYQNAMAEIFSKRLKGEQDHEQLKVTAAVLQQNPDVYTLWNIRKEVLLHFKTILSSEDFDSLLIDDLKLTVQCLGVNPKSYGVWHHRTWVIQNMTSPRWDFELKLCNKALELDERNFHCWDYRRFIAAKSGVSDEKELEFSTLKVGGNFSNYSAWHYRSDLLPRVHPSSTPGRPHPDVVRKELQLVQNAMFTDPNDQSAFFYHRWLLGRKEPKLSLSEIKASTADGRLRIVVSTTVPCPARLLEVTLGGSPVHWRWRSDCGEYSKIWETELEVNLPCDVTIAVSDSSQHFTANEDLKDLLLKNSEDSPTTEPVTADRDLLESELESLQQLLEMEPENKWVLLTCLHLLMSLRPAFDTEMAEILQKLQEIDPYRRCYYGDLRSKMDTRQAS